MFKRSVLITIIIMSAILLSISGCSKGSNPVIPQDGDALSMEEGILLSETGSIVSDSVFVTSANERVATYQGALAVALVTIDPETLEAEILPARNAQEIGDVFDADLTQFLLRSPCANCLQIGQMNVTDNGNIVMEFKVRHPFADIASRPDLHGFDVRGIVISPGSFEFPNTYIHLPDSTTEHAMGNANLLVNADGFTSHFDSLAENSIYFGAPKNFEGNINGFKRFFTNTSGGTFDPLAPEGHNVIKVGSGWSSAVYELKPPAVGHIEFVFVVDVAYGQSAKFSTRNSPQYYLPWFNRKEAWKLEVQILSNELLAETPQSAAVIRACVYDWQAGLIADPDYPDGGLNTIAETSDIKRVSLEIPGVLGNVEIMSVPDGGNGSPSNPYRFDFEVRNQLGALGGTYTGIVAARDDLDMTPGPMNVPEGPEGFPLEGPDIRDYALYKVFEIEVSGGANHDPVIMTAAKSDNNPIAEASLPKFSVYAIDPDADELTYYWQQLSPDLPQGTFEDEYMATTYWFAPRVDETTNFTFMVTIDDGRGGIVYSGFILQVNDVNRPPRIISGPYAFPFNLSEGEYTEIQCGGEDPDNDILDYQWLQVQPLSPLGEFSDPESPFTTWTAPAILVDQIFKIQIMISDHQYSASAILDIPVGAINEAPVGTIYADADPAVYAPSQNFQLNADFDDPDGNNIVLYEWDIDYDGITFDVDFDTGAIPTLNTNIADVGPKVVAVRGTDDGDPQLSDIPECNLIIRGKWGSNSAITGITAPSTRIGSRSNQKAVIRNGNDVHVIFENDAGTNTELRLISSDDGGVSFGSSVLIKSIANTVVYEYPTVAMNGDYIWVAWKEDNGVRFARSTNGGSSFDADYLLPPVTVNGDHAPSISYNSYSGNLFVVFADENGSGNGIITLYKSENNGAGFTHQASTVTDTTADTNYADIASASNGDIFVGWIDERYSANGDAYYAMSDDGGSSFGINRQVNLDYSQNGVAEMSMDIGTDNEAYFSWLDYRTLNWRTYFAKTSFGGMCVLENVNVSPSLVQRHRNPQIYVNDFGRIYISFTYDTGAGHKIIITSADYAGGNFTQPASQLNDTVTASTSIPLCDLSGRIHETGLADEVFVVWTDFANGESGDFGDCFGQRFLWEAY